MSISVASSRELPRAGMAALMLAAFTMVVGHGAVLPLLPYHIDWLSGARVEVAQVSWHMGLLTAVYTFSLFLFAPMWGRLASRYRLRGVLLTGLTSLGVTMLVFSFVGSLTAVYEERFLSGFFAAAVTPVAATAIGNFTTSEQLRLRRFAFISMAIITGFLLGPMLGVLVKRFAVENFTVALPAGSITTPLAATALLAFTVAAFAAFLLPSENAGAHLKLPHWWCDTTQPWLVAT